MADPTDWIEQATKVGVELKESIREAHGLLKDLRELRRELVVIQTTVFDGVKTRAHDAFNEAFNEGMDSYTQGLLKTTDAVFDDVNKLMENAIGEITTKVIAQMEQLSVERRKTL